MNILFYFPTNKASVSIESLAEAFNSKGHKVYLLGQEEKGVLHYNLEKFNVTCELYPIQKEIHFFFIQNI